MEIYYEDFFSYFEFLGNKGTKETYVPGEHKLKI